MNQPHCNCRHPGSLGGDCDGSCQCPPPDCACAECVSERSNVLTFTPRQPPPTGNGALEVIRDYFQNVHPARGHGATDCGAMLDGTAHLPAGDHFLMWLASEGFKVVPL